MQTVHQVSEHRPEDAQKVMAWHKAFPSPWALGGVACAAALVMGIYLLVSAWTYAIGFPLDDAWIHQTYARNLAFYGQWAFVPGEPSAGSTAPLWSLLLALGYILRLPPLVWTFFLGGLSLFALAAAGEMLLCTMLPDLRTAVSFAALFLLGEWHLAWAAASGMETLLFSALILLVFTLLYHASGKGWLWVGLLIGLTIWVRPDGITLLGPAGLVLWFGGKETRKRLRDLAWLVSGLLLLFLPYLLFNLVIQGSIWPNTFYAKQAEYAVQRQLPLLVRLFNELKLPLIGSGVFLLPGFVIFAWQAVSRRRWLALGIVLWFLGYGLLYALRLPVTYQYGRYFIPAMPVYFVAGLAGSVVLLAALRTGRARWLLARVGLISAVLIWLAFLGIGANRYGQDVAIIETEMVAAARWVADNTPPDALIAAHDIGALGYFGHRRLLDLAGLVSPEVIPFIRDESRIAGWLDARQAGYLVVFSNWYPVLPKGKTIMFETTGKFSSQSGGGRTKIYRWLPKE